LGISGTGTLACGAAFHDDAAVSLGKYLMANPHEFLENWVRESVQATPYRNKARIGSGEMNIDLLTTAARLFPTVPF
jgi:hypothetical protein